jgi:hypothetical protein
LSTNSDKDFQSIYDPEGFYLFSTNIGITRKTTSMAAKTRRVKIILNLRFIPIACISAAIFDNKRLSPH